MHRSAHRGRISALSCALVVAATAAACGDTRSWPQRSSAPARGATPLAAHAPRTHSHAALAHAPAASTSTSTGTAATDDAAAHSARGLSVFDATTSGARWLRVIIHAHSAVSSDACDGASRTPESTATCVTHLRSALCQDHIDALFLTEHSDAMALTDFDRLLPLAAGDAREERDGRVVGARIRCPDGHTAAVYPGAENGLMPIGFVHPPEVPAGGDPRARYNGTDRAAARRFRDAGALVAVPHTESRGARYLAELGPDLIEVYNMHANVDPDIRRAAGLAPGSFGPDLTRFSREPALPPDLAFLAFFEESVVDLARWAQLAQRQRVTAIAGTDAHENRFPAVMSDGERGDGYGRVMRWVANAVRVEGAPTREAVLDALARGHTMVAFEALGTPRGFRFEATQPGRASASMGDSVALAPELALVAGVPTLSEDDTASARPEVTVRVLRAEGAAWREVARGSGGEVRFVVHGPGVYRAEARIVPRHLAAQLPGMEHLVRELPWAYSNAIYVTAPRARR